MDEPIIKQLKKVNEASHCLVEMTDAICNKVLSSIAQQLRASSQMILQENQKDLANMPKEDPRYDRLLLTQERIENIARDIETVMALDSPLNKILEEKTRPNGLLLQRVSVPLGVVAVIYESRPNVTIDVFTLCFKAGNACVLKGGKEAEHSNRALSILIEHALKEQGINPNVFYLLPSNRHATECLLHAGGLVDACIPRGSHALIQFVREHARVPVIETGAGIVHTYFDESGDLEKGQRIVNNAKTRRVSVCNALDSLVIHESRLQDLPALVAPLQASKVTLLADEASYDALASSYPMSLLRHATPQDFGQEFLSYQLSIKTVADIAAAVQHIMTHTSGHSEAIIAESVTAINYFIKYIDAAAVYVNASTAFTDGAQFGLGAEIGISTQKLHARGPMGLMALTSYKWLIRGNGQIRA